MSDMLFRILESKNDLILGTNSNPSFKGLTSCALKTSAVLSRAETNVLCQDTVLTGINHTHIILDISPFDWERLILPSFNFKKAGFFMEDWKQIAFGVWPNENNS